MLAQDAGRQGPFQPGDTAMNTIPPVSFDAHLRNMLDWLRPLVPGLDATRLRFFDLNDLRHDGSRWSLPVSGLKDVGEMRELFERLCGEGRGWIHLAGEGASPEGDYLVSFDYSQDTGHGATFVNFAGPPLDADGNVRDIAAIAIT
jgi:hypothetical protein